MNTAYILIAVAIVAIVLTLRLHRHYRKTLRAIDSGFELLRTHDTSSRLARSGNADIDKIRDTFNNMLAELKASKEQVLEQNNLLNLLVGVSPMGIIMLDFDERIVSMNPAARQFLECPDNVVGKRIGELPSAIAQRMSQLNEKKAETFTTNNAHIFKCTRATFIDRGSHHPFFLIESLTEDVMAAEKKAYEKVIRMIAHEVNNSTATMMSILDMIGSDLQGYSEDTSDIGKLLQVCSERSQAMTDFISRLAEVVKIPDPIVKPVAVNSLVEDNAQFLESQCVAQNVAIGIRLSHRNPLVQADAALMSQVLINIVKNAIESIVTLTEEKPGHQGIVRIETTDEGNITVTDNGKGISPDVEQKIFTPFFSTKPTGNGLGLLFVREVLTRHRATFSLKTVDAETIFTLRLPQG